MVVSGLLEVGESGVAEIVVTISESASDGATDSATVAVASQGGSSSTEVVVFERRAG